MFRGSQAYPLSPPSLALGGRLHTHLQEPRDFRSTLVSGVLLIGMKPERGKS